MDRFGESARTMLVRAMKVAQELGDEQVRQDHLLLVASDEALQKVSMRTHREQLMRERERLEQLPRQRSPVTSTPDFAPSVCNLFVVALQFASNLGSDRIEEEHLLCAFDTNRLFRGAAPDRMPGPPTLADILTADVLAALGTVGVDVQMLASRAREIALPMFDPGFWKTEAGLKLFEVSARTHTHPQSARFCILLGILEAGTAGADLLSEAGVRREALYGYLNRLEGLSDAAQCMVESTLRDTDVDSAVNYPLTRAARWAIAHAWQLSGRRVVDDELLLTALLHADALVCPGGGARRILVSLGVHAEVCSAQRSVVSISEAGRNRVPVIGQLAQRALDLAHEAVSPAPVSTESLLLGLASLGEGRAFELLQSHGVTPVRIRETMREL